MAKKLVSFLVGVLISSAWWSIAVWPPNEDGKPYGWPIIPVFATIAFVILLVVVVIYHWDDGE